MRLALYTAALITMDAILQKVLARIDSQDKRLASIESTITKLSAVVTKISEDGNTQRELVTALNDALAKIKKHIADEPVGDEEASAPACSVHAIHFINCFTCLNTPPAPPPPCLRLCPGGERW